MTEIEYLKQENKKLVKALDDYGNKNFKYKRILEEIREILDSGSNDALWADLAKRLAEIQNKINEVLNDRD